MKTKLLATICAVLSFASPLVGAGTDYFLVRKAGTLEPYLQLTLENVLVSSLSSTATRGTSTQDDTSDDSRTDDVSFHFSKITVTCIGADGTATTGSAEVTPEEEAPLR